MPTEYLPPMEQGRIHRKKSTKNSWIGQINFALIIPYYSFFRKDGRTNFSLAWNLAMGLCQPKTSKEHAFRDDFILEVERRFPGESYPKGCIRRVIPKCH
ncbi:hypothetical protein [Sulfitobacter guttiformis]|uniref:Uncharacterized protein n=1 Tax=Sulfitobacter guttiformis TaxID=74349 RepID=A0A420DNT8_9RHOB|nr:hypothetical protein [Sulfitobacter guttiformis]RKE95936.1 hypothetical protein C8N30_0483 [Sulfitobacter guttiformis]